MLDYFEEWLAEAEVQAELMAKYVGVPDQGLTHRQLRHLLSSESSCAVVLLQGAFSSVQERC